MKEMQSSSAQSTLLQIDQAYIQARNALIPLAEAEAFHFFKNSEVKGYLKGIPAAGKHETVSALQIRKYHDSMNRLAYERGIVSYYKPAIWPWEVSNATEQIQ
jgi:hypothetical protein